MVVARCRLSPRLLAGPAADTRPRVHGAPVPSSAASGDARQLGTSRCLALCHRVGGCRPEPGLVRAAAPVRAEVVVTGARPRGRSSPTVGGARRRVLGVPAIDRDPKTGPRCGGRHDSAPTLCVLLSPNGVDPFSPTCPTAGPGRRPVWRSARLADASQGPCRALVPPDSSPHRSSRLPTRRMPPRRLSTSIRRQGRWRRVGRRGSVLLPGRRWPGTCADGLGRSVGRRFVAPCAPARSYGEAAWRRQNADAVTLLLVDRDHFPTGLHRTGRHRPCLGDGHRGHGTDHGLDVTSSPPLTPSMASSTPGSVLDQSRIGAERSPSGS